MSIHHFQSLCINYMSKMSSLIDQSCASLVSKLNELANSEKSFDVLEWVIYCISACHTCDMSISLEMHDVYDILRGWYNKFIESYACAWYTCGNNFPRLYSCIYIPSGSFDVWLNQPGYKYIDISYNYVHQFLWFFF